MAKKIKKEEREYWLAQWGKSIGSPKLDRIIDIALDELKDKPK